MTRTDLAIMGQPQDSFTSAATIRVQFDDPVNVATLCMIAQIDMNQVPTPAHACVYAKEGEPIMMILPTPGTVSDEVFGQLVRHEYQHVGQIIQDEPVGHRDWK